MKRNTNKEAMIKCLIIYQATKQYKLINKKKIKINFDTIPTPLLNQN